MSNKPQFKAAYPYQADVLALPVTDHILGEIAQITGLKLVTLRVECRTRLCRLRMARQELSRENPFPDLVGRVGLKPLWVIAGMDRNGVPNSIAYFERE